MMFVFVFYVFACFTYCFLFYLFDIVSLKFNNALMKFLYSRIHSFSFIIKYMI